jgi:hypothetical protein
VSIKQQLARLWTAIGAKPDKPPENNAAVRLAAVILCDHPHLLDAMRAAALAETTEGNAEQAAKLRDETYEQMVAIANAAGIDLGEQQEQVGDASVAPGILRSDP